MSTAATAANLTDGKFSSAFHNLFFHVCVGVEIFTKNMYVFVRYDMGRVERRGRSSSGRTHLAEELGRHIMDDDEMRVSGSKQKNRKITNICETWKMK
jgi:hypothetical protein